MVISLIWVGVGSFLFMERTSFSLGPAALGQPTVGRKEAGKAILADDRGTLRRNHEATSSPVLGATKLRHIEGAAKAVELELSGEELEYLEAPYVPHPLAEVMAQNKPANAQKAHVLSTGDQIIES